VLLAGVGLFTGGDGSKIGGAISRDENDPPITPAPPLLIKSSSVTHPMV